MAQTKENEKFLISTTNSNFSPFIVDDEFNYTSTYDIRTFSSDVRDICINNNNNQQIAYASKGVFTSLIFQHSSTLEETVTETIDEWDRIITNPESDSSAAEKAYDEFESPFNPTREVRQIKLTQILRASYKSFSCNWKKVRMSSKEVDAKCITSHPTQDLFVTGDVTGSLHLWDFNNPGHCLSVAKYTNRPLKSLFFNGTGDKICCVNSEGLVLISDFQHANSLQVPKNSSVQWLNNDAQLVVIDYDESALNIYDLLCGNHPIATFQLKSKIRGTSNLAVNGSYIACGFDDGSGLLFDTRRGYTVAHFPLHEGKVTSVKFDPSGTFLVMGGIDNSISIVEKSTILCKKQFVNVLPSNSKKSGIKSVAVSKHAIVACGYSSCIHTWTSLDPKQMIDNL
ncbi:WD-40 repeat-containing protein [Histomonas meleagridis]|uniref:WD-40 repeat-containing protein n=1 Tax=Histomonas meleagridis TaxID=135588 RepID=UPI003559DE7B|nr:WD-40 repeat-containing protein [Histomonas meleagridis]KAH0802227.1 WD-40 repeat-containing protein [Histomonas meleagridis]